MIKTFLALRTCAADMTSHGGFRWPTSGLVEAPDWDPTPQCGGNGATVSGGNGSALIVQWWDGRRPRLAVAIVGENGIEPHTRYRLDAAGQFERVAE